IDLILDKNGNFAWVDGSAWSTVYGWYPLNNIYDGQWHLISVTKSGSILNIYQDAVLVKSGTYGNSIVSNNNNLLLGTYSPTFAPINGLIDDVRLYTTALSVQEIESIYTGSSVNETNVVEILPEVTKLYQNYPNPFNPETTIKFDLAESANVMIDIYNINGQLVRTLVNGFKNAGTVTATWDGKDKQGSIVSAGVYIYRMSTDTGYNKVMRAVMIK
ncbi:MAG: T9SS type A sorting domain-containing protein, partial [Candidatus Delongbacteria bacterium]|nr:T9SS type A sorting domain-containing protein [Candidatus Delongbacteria bacterium]